MHEPNTFPIDQLECIVSKLYSSTIVAKEILVPADPLYGIKEHTRWLPISVFVDVKDIQELKEEFDKLKQWHESQIRTNS